MSKILDILGAWILPLMVTATVAVGLIKKVKVFDCFIEGAKKALITCYELLPTITGLVLAVTMLTESGAMELAARLFSPLTRLFGAPAGIAPLALLSPISGGGSLSLFEAVLKSDGPDSFLGRVASVLMGSTDTTLYAVTVYYGAVSVKNTRHTLYAGLAADFTSFALSSLFVRLTVSG